MAPYGTCRASCLPRSQRPTIRTPPSSAKTIAQRTAALMRNPRQRKVSATCCLAVCKVSSDSAPPVSTPRGGHGYVSPTASGASHRRYATPPGPNGLLKNFQVRLRTSERKPLGGPPPTPPPPYRKQFVHEPCNPPPIGRSVRPVCREDPGIRPGPLPASRNPSEPSPEPRAPRPVVVHQLAAHSLGARSSEAEGVATCSRCWRLRCDTITVRPRASGVRARLVPSSPNTRSSSRALAQAPPCVRGHQRRAN
ncbi:hypothetical protein LXA43DRAFT_1039497 [Ganoderma leucocontextum]|nr:hypothetical protein LXA43DRAFT_1039497 [Ganoderma leucocontextum]